MPGEFDAAKFAAAVYAAGLNPTQLAVQADLAPSTVYQWAEGRNTPTVMNLERAAAVLGMKAADFTKVDPATADLAGLRFHMGKSSKEVADFLKVSEAVLDNIERGRVRLTEERETLLAQALQLPKERIRGAYQRVRPPRKR